MDKIDDWIHQITGLNIEVQDKIYVSIFTIVVLWLIRFVTYRIVLNKTENAQTRYRWQKSLTYSTVIIGLILIGRVWFTGMGSLATYLGLLSAGIAIALKDIFVSLAGWIFLIWRRPFSVGDRIQIGNIQTIASL